MSPQGAFVHVMKRLQDGGRRYRLLLAEDGSQIRQQSDAEARFGILRLREQSQSCIAGDLRPFTPNNIGNSNKRFPDIGIAVLNASGHLRPSDVTCQSPRPGLDRVTDTLSIDHMDTAPELFDHLALMTPTHLNNDRARQDGVGEPT